MFNQHPGTVPVVDDQCHRRAKYYTCCCHVKTAATVLGVISIVSSCILITYCVYNMIEFGRSKYDIFDQFKLNLPLAMSLVFSLISLVFVCCMFYGLMREYPLLLIAHLAVHLLTIVCWTAIATVKIVYVVRQSDFLKRYGMYTVWMATLIALIVYLILQIYYFYISYKCFLYVKEKRTTVIDLEMCQSQCNAHRHLWATQISYGLSSLQSPPYYSATVLANSNNSAFVFPAATAPPPPPPPPPYDVFHTMTAGTANSQQVVAYANVAPTPPPCYTVAASTPTFQLLK